jgi:hypothetical protein
VGKVTLYHRKRQYAVNWANVSYIMYIGMCDKIAVYSVIKSEHLLR